MDTPQARWRHAPGVILGAVVMLFGVVLTLDNFGVLRSLEVGRYWPVLVIALGLTQLTQSLLRRTRPQGLVLTLFGVGLLLLTLGAIRFRLLIALGFLVIGTEMVWRALQRSRQLPVAPDPRRNLDVFTFMGSVEPTLNTHDFGGGRASAVLGGCDIDLRNASIEAGEVVVDTFAFWGGVEIAVPRDWAVELRGTAVLGSFDDTTRKPDDDRKKLVVTGYAFMGAVEVKN